MRESPIKLNVNPVCRVSVVVDHCSAQNAGVKQQSRYRSGTRHTTILDPMGRFINRSRLGEACIGSLIAGQSEELGLGVAVSPGPTMKTVLS